MIKSFTDLKAWQSGHELSIQIYQYTNKFPKSEQFGLVSQMRRAAVSVTSNIAEGFGRSSEKDKEHFYVMASGSLYELKSQVLLAKDLGFIDNEDINFILDKLVTAHKLVNGLLRAHRGGKSNV